MADRSIDTMSLSAGDGRSRVDKLLERVAVLMLPAGAVLILLGWYGASRTPFVFEQIPYLISGGLLGAGVMIAGGLLYVGSWISRSARTSSGGGADVDELAATLKSIAAANGSGANGHGAQYVATPSGTMFHRPDCAIVAERDDVRPVDPDADDTFTPCKMCDPLTV